MSLDCYESLILDFDFRLDSISTCPDARYWGNYNILNHMHFKTGVVFILYR